MSVRLSAPARRLILGTTLSAFGTGLTLPFTLILLHEVRGISLPVTGALLALPGIVGLAAVPVSGALVDRIGPRRVLRGAMLFQALANLVLAQATSVPVAALSLVLLGVGLGPSFPAIGALLAGLAVGREQQARAFGLQFTLLNAAIGSAALLGALVVDVERPMTFVWLYVGNAASCLVFALLVPPAAVRSAEADEEQPSYREVLGDPVFRRVCLVSLLLALTGYAALDGGLPAYARVVGDISPSVIALVFTVNTVMIVSGQLLVVRLLRGRRRSSALAAAGLVWGVAWLTLGSLAVLPEGAPRIVAALAFGAVFAVGETLMAPTLSPLVNALATDRLRGRYNAMSGATFSIAFVVAPALSGALIGFGLSVVWLVLLVGGCVAVAVVARSLRGRLSDEQDGIGPAEVAAEPALV